MRLGSYLAVGLLVSLLALVLFGILAHHVVQEGDLAQMDRQVSRSLEAHGQEHPEIRKVLWIVTQLGGVPVLTVGTVIVGLVLVGKRLQLLALVWLIAMAGGAVLNEVLKLTFERPRPRFDSPVLQLHSYSFPSGHSMGSLVFYGFLTYLVTLAMPRRWERWLIFGLFAILVLAIGFSRLYLGAHWPTDVLAGYAAAAVWLSCCITAAEGIRRRSV